MTTSQHSHLRVRRLPRGVVKAYSILLFGQLALGSGGVFGRIALLQMGSLFTAAARLGMAALPLVLRMVVVRGQLYSRRVEFKLLAAGGCLGLAFAGWTASLALLSVGTSTLLTCTSPLWSGLYEALVLRRPMPRMFWLCNLLGGCSLALLLQDVGGGPHTSPGGVAIGMAWGMGSSMFTSAYFILVRSVSRQSTFATVDIITRTYSYAAVLLMVFCLLWERQPMPALTHWQPWAAVAAMALITQGLGHTAQNAALRALRPSVVGVASLMEPLIAAVMAYFWFGEPLTWRLAVGGTTLLAGLGYALHIAAYASDGQTKSNVPSDVQAA